MKVLKYKGITFDDFAQNDCGTYYAEICERCVKKHHDRICHDISEGGCPGSICGVEGCFHNGDNENHYYIDFDPKGVEFEDVTENDTYDKQYI